jgi:gliding motility-associated lipoprotein GldD
MSHTNLMPYFRLYLKRIFLLVGVFLFLSACEPSYIPKPKGYPLIELPNPTYEPLKLEAPYTFEHSGFAMAAPDTTRLSEPYWIDIIYKELGATVQVTYKPINKDKQKLNELVEDARMLIAKHQIKASGIEEQVIKTGSGHNAYVFRISGQVPTQFQFYTTDSSKHFLRGALYFNTATANDSLAPVIDFVSKDMIHLLQTLKWTR